MKRRLTLAIGCLTATIPAVAQLHRASPTLAANVAPARQAVDFLRATQLAQSELERRGLAAAHSIVSAVFLKGILPGTGHYDVRIEPPAILDAARLRGFAVAMDGGVAPLSGFRVAEGAIFSNQTSGGPPEESGLQPGGGEG